MDEHACNICGLMIGKGERFIVAKTWRGTMGPHWWAQEEYDVYWFHEACWKEHMKLFRS